MYLTKEKAGKILRFNYGHNSDDLTFNITATFKVIDHPEDWKLLDQTGISKDQLEDTQESLGDFLVDLFKYYQANADQHGTLTKDMRWKLEPPGKDVIEKIFAKNYDHHTVMHRVYQFVSLDILSLTIYKLQGQATKQEERNKKDVIYNEIDQPIFRLETELKNHTISLTFKYKNKEEINLWVFLDQIRPILQECKPDEKDIAREVKKFLQKEKIKNLKLKDVEIKKATKNNKD